MAMKQKQHEGAVDGHTVKPPKKVIRALAAVVVEAELARSRASSSVDMVKLIYDIPDDQLLRLVAEFVSEAGDVPQPEG